LPYLIEFDNLSNARDFCKKISKIIPEKRFVKNEKEIISVIERDEKSWQSYDITSFQFLNTLNLFSGRYYQNSKNYPVFPSIHSIECYEACSDFMPSLNRTFNQTDKFDGNIEYNDRVFVLPELYYLFESDVPENVYQRRKELESQEHLKAWITKACFKSIFVYYQTQQERDKFRPLQCKSQQLNLNHQITNDNFIIYISQIQTPNDENSFCVVYENGEIRFYRIKFSNSEFVLEEFGEKYTIPNISQYRFYSFESGIFAFSNSTLYIKYPNKVIQKSFIYIEKAIFSNNVFMPNPSIISKINFEKFESPSFLCFAKDNVVCLNANPRLSVFAYGTQNGEVHIHSLITGKRISSYSLNNEIPEKILITNCIGFICIQTQTRLIILSINGTYIKSMSFAENKVSHFENWFQFNSYDGKDKLNKDDFLFGLRECGINLPENDIQIILNFFEKDNDGMINFSEFLTALRGKPNERRQAIIDKLF